MSNLKLTTLWVFALSLITFSCSTDFEVNAPYRELPIVYGLLDASDSVQYIRIMKGFQNTGGQDARDIAQNIADSSYYEEGEIKAELFLGTTLANTLERVILPEERSEGSFTRSPNIMYRTTKGFQLTTKVGNNPALYRLRITNLKTGTVAEAQTEIVGNFEVDTPYINPAAPNSSDKFSIDNPSVVLKRERPAFFYRIKLHITYFETQNGVTETKKLHWEAISSKEGTKSFGEYEVIPFGNSRIMLQFLQQNIDTTRDNINTKRKMGDIQFDLSAGEKSFRDYLIINGLYSELSQSKPVYSNVTGGLGLLTSRYQKTLIATKVRVPQVLTNPTGAYKSLKFYR